MGFWDIGWAVSPRRVSAIVMVRAESPCVTYVTIEANTAFTLTLLANIPCRVAQTSRQSPLASPHNTFAQAPRSSKQPLALLAKW